MEPMKRARTTKILIITVIIIILSCSIYWMYTQKGEVSEATSNSRDVKMFDDSEISLESTENGHESNFEEESEEEPEEESEEDEIKVKSEDVVVQVEAQADVVKELEITQVDQQKQKPGIHVSNPVELPKIIEDLAAVTLIISNATDNPEVITTENEENRIRNEEAQAEDEPEIKENGTVVNQEQMRIKENQHENEQIPHDIQQNQDHEHMESELNEAEPHKTEIAETNVEVEDNFLNEIVPKAGYTLLHSVAITCRSDHIRKVVATYPTLLDELTADDQMKTAAVLVIEKCENAVECLDALEGARLKVFCAGTRRRTAIYYAVKKNSPVLVEYLLRRGSSANSYSNGKPILHHAIKYCTETTFPQIFKLLMEYGAILTTKNNDNRMAIHEAAAIDKVHVIRTICRQYPEELERRTPKYKGTEILTDELLLKEKKMYGATALHIAAKLKSENSYRELLLKLGATKGKRDYFGKPALFYNPRMEFIIFLK